jgi:quercetin dioxygenase-like cupin family protein
MSGREIMH